MSFQDDLIEPEAIESAEHFSGLIRLNQEPAVANPGTEAETTRRERLNLRRPLPRDLGN